MSSTTLSYDVCQNNVYKLHINSQELEWPLHQFPKEFGFILNLRGRISSGIAGQFFVTKRSQGFAGHRIHEATFGISCFTDRGSGDSLVISTSSCFWRPVPVGTVRSKSRVGSMGRPMLMKLQGLFRLSKIEL
jgi:hypothetical protein